MGGYNLDRTRRRIGYGALALFGLLGTWSLTPGLPVLWGPRASAAEKAAGRALFEHAWRPYDVLAGGDGLGPVFNARSCAECHFQGGMGGGGDNKHNVLAFEALPTPDRPDVKGGLVHKFAVDNRFLEGGRSLREFFPIVPNGIRLEGGCQILTIDFDPVNQQSVNTTALFGAGWIDRIPAKTITHESLKTSVARVGRELQGDFQGFVPGRPRVLPDGRVGKFGWKAQFATLEEFVAAACANEIGLSNPRMDQAKPLVKAAYYPPDTPDLDRKQFRSLVSYVDTLRRPEEVLPDDAGLRSKAGRGKGLFRSVGCAACHTPDLGGVAGVYSDFLLHRLDDREKGSSGYREVRQVPLPHEHPLPEEWKTPPLWGVADSAPYFHDGGSHTLEAAILRHLGDAASVTEAYKALSAADRAAVVEFLKTLKAPAAAEPAGTGAKGAIAMAR
jgi:mono/diheme cytochrome c family protein